jgi:uncharacterized protein (TIGR03437 family)
MVALACGCNTGGDIPSPMIASITPNHASPGAAVLISGDYFCQQPGADEVDPLACANMGTVAFGTTPATVGMYSEQMIAVDVPGLEPKSYSVTVSVAGHRSNAVAFTVDAP